MKKNLQEELSLYIIENMDKIVEAAKESLRIESVIENDPMYMKEEKRYAFVGIGCAFVWIEFDKRSKKAKEIYEISRSLKFEISTLFENQFDKKTIEYYRRIGCPLRALFQQDEGIQNTYFWVVAEFMIKNGCKKAMVNSRLD